MALEGRTDHGLASIADRDPDDGGPLVLMPVVELASEMGQQCAPASDSFVLLARQAAIRLIRASADAAQETRS